MPMPPPVTMATLSVNRMASPPFPRRWSARLASTSAPTVIRVVVERPHLGVHGHVAAPALGAPLARLPVLALHRALGLGLQVLVPLAEIVAVPRHLRAESGQAQLFPDLARPFHELALGQRDRGEGFLEHGVDEDGRV